jgi:hypothetical protein
MAPEQLLGKPVMASDVYALALIGYEMWTGKALLKADTPVALYEEQRHLRESRLDGAGGERMPAGVRAALWEGLHVNPAKRPPVEQFAAKLAREIRNPGRQIWLPSRRELFAGAAVAVPAAAWLIYQNRPLSEAERTVVYQAGQTFDALGWKKAGRIDLDVTVTAPDGSRILGNRLVTSDQGAYFYPLTPRVRSEGLKRRWRLTGEVMPVAGYAGFGVCFREVGIRFLMAAEVPASGDSLITATETYTPEVRKLTVPFQFTPGRFYQLEMIFDPNTRSASVAVDGRVVLQGYRGTREYLEVPGIAVGFGLYQSKTAEAVFGDVTFVMD